MDRIIGPGNQLSKDVASGTDVAIDFEHSMIHRGLMFHLFGNVIDLDTDETIIIAFKTPTDDPEIHMVAQTNGSTGFRLEILEAPTVTVDTGTIIDSFNRNRNKTNISEISSIEATPQGGKANLDPTVTADGLVIQDEVSGGVGAGPISGESGASRNLGEIELKTDTVYAFRVTSLDDNNTVHMNLIWYELEE